MATIQTTLEAFSFFFYLRSASELGKIERISIVQRTKYYSKSNEIARDLISKYLTSDVTHREHNLPVESRTASARRAFLVAPGNVRRGPPRLAINLNAFETRDLDILQKVHGLPNVGDGSKVAWSKYVTSNINRQLASRGSDKIRQKF